MLYNSPFFDVTVSRRPKTATLDTVLRVVLTVDGLGTGRSKYHGPLPLPPRTTLVGLVLVSGS